MLSKWPIEVFEWQKIKSTCCWWVGKLVRWTFIFSWLVQVDGERKTKGGQMHWHRQNGCHTYLHACWPSLHLDQLSTYILGVVLKSFVDDTFTRTQVTCRRQATRHMCSNTAPVYAFYRGCSPLRIRKYTKKYGKQPPFWISSFDLSKCKETLRMLLVCVEIPPLCKF